EYSFPLAIRARVRVNLSSSITHLPIHSFTHSHQPDILISHRQVIDAAVRRGDPTGHLSWFDHALHQALYERAVTLARKPTGQQPIVFLLTHSLAAWVG